jgi:TnpA family transposase
VLWKSLNLKVRRGHFVNLRARELLTPEQRKDFMTIPSTLSNWELAYYYTLSQDDIEVIKRRRRDHNRLGFAIQICLFRYPGWTLTDIKHIPDRVITYVAKQLQVDPNEYKHYADREQTKHEHMEEIRKHYGFTNFSIHSYRTISKVLIPHAIENGNAMFLIRLTLEEMRKQKIILPAMTVIERLVWETRRRAEEKVFLSLNKPISLWQKHQLEKLLETPSDKSKTKLGWLREIPGQSSPDAFLKVIERLEFIRTINLSTDTEYIHSNWLLQLAKLGSRYEPHSLRRFNERKKYAILVAHLLTLSQDLIDQAIEIHDRQIMILQSKGRKAQDELQKQNGKSINEKVLHFADIGEALVKAKNEGLDPFEVKEKIMPWDKIVDSIEEAKLLARPKDYDYLDLLITRFTYLRKYTPVLLNKLEFHKTQASEPIMRAINVIREMNDNKNVSYLKEHHWILYLNGGKSMFMMRMAILIESIMN